MPDIHPAIVLMIMAKEFGSASNHEWSEGEDVVDDTEHSYFLHLSSLLLFSFDKYS